MKERRGLGPPYDGYLTDKIVRIQVVIASGHRAGHDSRVCFLRCSAIRYQHVRAA